MNADEHIRRSAASAINAVVEGMGRFSGDAELQARRDVFEHLVRYETLAAAGSVRTPSDAPPSLSQEIGAAALANLAPNTGNQARVAAVGGVRAVINAMRAHTDSVGADFTPAPRTHSSPITHPPTHPRLRAKDPPHYGMHCCTSCGACDTGRVPGAAPTTHLHAPRTFECPNIRRRPGAWGAGAQSVRH